MGKGLTTAQRKAVADSDTATGRLSARPEVCLRLVAAGLAAPHGRGGHHAYYLTPQGLRLRAELAARRRSEPTTPSPRAPGRGGFTADDGTGTLTPSPGRAAEVAGAWEGLLQIRSVLMDGARDVPAPWERERLVHAVSLALEATGCPPARPAGADPAEDPGSAGYRVTAAPHPGTVRVDWPGPADPDSPTSGPGRYEAPLTRVADLLVPRGWQPTQHRERDGTPYLLVTPRR